MSIKIAIMNDGTQVLSEIKEVTEPGGGSTQYLFNKPYEVIFTPEILLTEDENGGSTNTKRVGLKTWIEISADSFFLVNPSSVMTITEPIADLKKMYEEINNGSNS